MRSLNDQDVHPSMQHRRPSSKENGANNGTVQAIPISSRLGTTTPAHENQHQSSHEPQTTTITLQLVPKDLKNLWGVASKAQSSLWQGYRLENLTWRLWHRYLFSAMSPNTAARSSSEAREGTLLTPPAAQILSEIQQSVRPAKLVSRDGIILADHDDGFLLSDVPSTGGLGNGSMGHKQRTNIPFYGPPAANQLSSKYSLHPAASSTQHHPPQQKDTTTPQVEAVSSRAVANSSLKVGNSKDISTEDCDDEFKSSLTEQESNYSTEEDPQINSMGARPVSKAAPSTRRHQPARKKKDIQRFMQRFSRCTATCSVDDDTFSLSNEPDHLSVQNWSTNDANDDEGPVHREDSGKEEANGGRDHEGQTSPIPRPVSNNKEKEGSDVVLNVDVGTEERKARSNETYPNSNSGNQGIDHRSRTPKRERASSLQPVVNCPAALLDTPKVSLVSRLLEAQGSTTTATKEHPTLPAASGASELPREQGSPLNRVLPPPPPLLRPRHDLMTPLLVANQNIPNDVRLLDELRGGGLSSSGVGASSFFLAGRTPPLRPGAPMLVSLPSPAAVESSSSLSKELSTSSSSSSASALSGHDGGSGASASAVASNDADFMGMMLW